MSTLRLADGTLISTEDGKRTVSTEINEAYADEPRQNVRGSSDFVLGTRRFLDDMPMPFHQSRPVAIIAAYTLFGLAAGDIARILRIETHEVIAVRESNDYRVFLDAMLQNVREHDGNKVRKKLHKNAKFAAGKIVELMQSEKEEIALKASQDVLNRTGHAAKDIVEHQHKMDGGITIRVIEETKAPPVIDMEANDAD